MSRISKELQELNKLVEEDLKIDEENIESLEVNQNLILSLEEYANCMSDKRLTNYVYHSLESILLLVIFGIMARCNTFVEIYLFMNKHQAWLKEHINFDYGFPSLSTIKRVIGMIKPEELESVLNDSLKMHLGCVERYYEDDDIVIKDLKCMDGKTANSSDRKSSKNGKVSKTNAMSLMSVVNDMCEATEFIDSKTNEIPSGIKLLEKVDITDCIVVFDALNTQTKTIDYIATHGAYYVVPVKGNQKALEDDITLFFEDETNYKKVEGKNYLKIVEKDHSTVEIREYLFVDDIDWIYDKADWKDIKGIGFCRRTYINSEGKEITDTRYYITNINPIKIVLISNAVRGEWTIENGLHLYLDMAFLEDKNKCFLENSQKNLNLIRKYVLAILKKYKLKTKLSMNSIRFNMCTNFENEIDTILKEILK